jgi:acylphosphatase
MPAERLQAVAHGRVQGVGFRQFVVTRAEELELAGYVRNRWDRSVEVVAEGDRARLEQLLETVRRGPRVANVTRVDVLWMGASGEFDGFDVRY